MGFKKSGNYFLLVREGVKNMTQTKKVLKDIVDGVSAK
jgi:hypothetical protein